MSLPASPSDSDFSRALQLMDAVDELRYEESVLQGLLNEEDSLAAIKQRLAKTYADNGLLVSDELIEKAVTLHLDRRLTHRPPANTASVRLARLYIRSYPHLGSGFLKWTVVALVVLLACGVLYRFL